jgi:hypothetical protein
MEYGKQQISLYQRILRSVQKWFAGLALPVLLVVYGIWVILPPYTQVYHGGHILSSEATVWTLITLIWGVIAICVAMMCFCWNFSAGMTERVWVKVLWITSGLILCAGGLGLFLLLCAAGFYGKLRHYR